MTVLVLLCSLGETPMRLYGQLWWIETTQVDASESDPLAFLDLAFGQIPVLVTALELPPSFLKPFNSTPFVNSPPIIGPTSIGLVGRSLGGCGS